MLSACPASQTMNNKALFAPAALSLKNLRFLSKVVASNSMEIQMYATLKTRHQWLNALLSKTRSTCSDREESNLSYLEQCTTKKQRTFTLLIWPKNTRRMRKKPETQTQLCKSQSSATTSRRNTEQRCVTG